MMRVATGDLQEFAERHRHMLGCTRDESLHQATWRAASLQAPCQDETVLTVQSRQTAPARGSTHSQTSCCAQSASLQHDSDAGCILGMRQSGCCRACTRVHASSVLQRRHALNRKGMSLPKRGPMAPRAEGFAAIQLDRVCPSAPSTVAGPLGCVPILHAKAGSAWHIGLT